MALIYTKLLSPLDKTTVLAPRQGGGRKFDFDDDWTEIRVGAFLVGVAATGSNDVNVTESVTLTTYLDRITFGIKNSDTEDAPGAAGTLFLGATTRTGLPSYSAAAQGFRSDSGGSLVAAGYNGASIIGGTVAEDLGGIMGFPDASGASGYNGFFCIRYRITNLGLSSQSVGVSLNNNATTVAGTDYSANALRTLMNNATFLTERAIAWNDGASAYDIPDAYYVRTPFYNNTLRLSAIRAIRYAPA
ncbi:MAG TPA: hypothetical protein VHS96_17140 [Bacteroidia bacterium]|nr:hypothetical protein [Bacteroidia bacterium]